MSWRKSRVKVLPGGVHVPEVCSWCGKSFPMYWDDQHDYETQSRQLIFCSNLCKTNEKKAYDEAQAASKATYNKHSCKTQIS